MSSGAGSTDDRWSWKKNAPSADLLAHYGLDSDTLENILSISVINVQDEYEKIAGKFRNDWGDEWELFEDLLDGKDSPLYGERVRDDDGGLQRIIGNFGHIPLALPVTPLPTEHEQLVSSEISTLPVPPDFMRRRIRYDGLHSGDFADDLTVELRDILRMNKRLRENIDAGAPQMIVDDIQELLTYHVSVYLDNESEDYPPGRARSGRTLVTVAQRIRHRNPNPFSEAYGVDYMRGIPDN